MKKQILFLALMLLPIVSYAEKQKVGGIWYDLDDIYKTASVTHGKKNDYYGNIVVPSEIYSIDNQSYYQVTSIGYQAFYNCRNVKSLILPESVKYISTGAFYGCSSLRSINIPDSVKLITNQVFYGCSSLTSIQLPEGINSIDGEAFYGCTSLSSIKLPESVTYIGLKSFKNCSNLSSINIPESVIQISEYAFDGCSNLFTIEIPDNIFLQHGALDNTGWIESQPDGVIYAGKYVYSYKGSLSNEISIHLRDDVTYICDYAFYDCRNLTSINIPNSISLIGSYAFFRCEKLNTLTCYMVNPMSFPDNVFPNNTKTNCKLIIPAGTRSKYVEKGWTANFKEVEEMEDGEPIWLSIVDAERGCTKLKCERGKAYTFKIEPVEGWHIHSVTYKGADVTSSLNSEKEFTTPAMAESSELNITYAKGNAIKGVGGKADVKITVLQNNVVVSGLNAGENVSVYDIEGHLQTTATSNGSPITLHLAKEQTYIVKAADEIVKVFVK